MSARTMGNIAEATRKQLQETVRFMSVQARIWRNLSIIHAHHPECTKDSMMVMALNGTLVGNIDLLETKEKELMLQAQKCGRTLGVFGDDPKNERCQAKQIKLWKIAKPQAATEERDER